MKKKSSLIIVAVVALALGSLLGANLGTANSNQTKGDINAVNDFNQLLLSPDNMAFNKAMAGNEEVLDNTVSTLQIVVSRITDFNALVDVLSTVSSAPFAISSADGQKALTQAKDALQAALQLKAGEKVDMKKALKDAKAAMAFLDTQMALGKQFVAEADEFLNGKDVKENIVVATIRDLMVSHCSVNASLTQNDSEADYWGNISGVVKHEDMAISVGK